MVSLRSIFSTAKTTRNFWVALAIRNSGERKAIVFRNGSKLNLTWPEYIVIRDIVAKGYKVEPFREIFLFKKGNVKIAGPLPQVSILLDDFNEQYLVDCKGKTILDVGGFIGETAVFFWAQGAAKLVIYEPVLSHHPYIKTNIELNGINAELHEEGIGETDGYLTVHYERTDPGFAYANKGYNKMTIKTKSAKRIIEESHADIAKFDCECGEQNLASVPDQILRKIPIYIIETHSTTIKNSLTRKFQNAGFTLAKDIPNDTALDTSVVLFKLA